MSISGGYPGGGVQRKYPDAKRSNPRVALRRFLSERGDFVVVPDYTSTGISNFPDSVLRKAGLEVQGNSA